MSYSNANANASFKVLTLTQGSQEWLDVRAKHITATEVAHLKCGLTSLYTLIGQKRGQIPLPFLDHVPAVQEGKYFEPFIRKGLVSAHPWLLNDGESDLDQPCVESLEEPFFMASLDGFSYRKNVVVELKNIYSKADTRFEDVKQNGLNSKAVEEFGYFYQVQWQLYVTGANVGMLCFHHSDDGKTFNPQNLLIFPIKRDEAVIEELKNLAYKVKEILDNNLQIEPDNGDELFLSDQQETLVSARIEQLKLIEDMLASQSEIVEKLKLKKQYITDSLKDDLLGDGKNKVCGKEFTLNVYERKGSIDYEQILIDHNIDLSIVEKYRKKPSVSTRLTLK